MFCMALAHTALALFATLQAKLNLRWQVLIQKWWRTLFLQRQLLLS